MWDRVVLVITDLSEERMASIIRVKRISVLRFQLANFCHPDGGSGTFLRNVHLTRAVLYCIVLYCIYSAFKTSMRRIQNTVNIQHTDKKYIKLKVLNIIIKINIKSTTNKQLWARKSQDKTFHITEYEINWESMSRTTMYLQNNPK
jgi:hypothetical protein